ncbi:transcription factor bHLH96 isoform X2 [Pyrus x bretschneideri]|uniref:transcription factor bHLH96 isoform X2 n=1 Tax=Pyrus x bretschneideri TaxID=225117 RepID=UPI00202F8547|nr:transcription factor bHLH96 isoform X2 [Pyrus x bretschneideri]
MALEAVVFPQDPFSCTNKDLYNLLGGNLSYVDDQQQASLDFLGYQTDQNYPNYDTYSSPPSMVSHFSELHLSNPNPVGSTINTAGDQPEFQLPLEDTINVSSSTRAKRRRAKSKKNEEEIENQRMTHIAVERNRRKQMNEYLSVLRSIMPESYVQRGDQASIIGGAINFVKELEQEVQFLGVQKPNNRAPFSEFFTFPQYSTRSTSDHESTVATMAELPLLECRSSNIAADIEVTMVESHASLKVRSKRLPKQLLKIVSGLHDMHLTVLHLNVVTADDIVLYSLSLKVEDECMLTSVDEIATAVHEMLARIQEEAMLDLN